ncbi:hypothetical protein [Winogradskyella sp.]|uniref:hypothetical protein n=1 Tax=Winogradskyella sp. TaxID=1883156 RepID=UPI00261AE59E|nr:hypothetical protein [Winogradskyella sp.]
MKKTIYILTVLIFSFSCSNESGNNSQEDNPIINGDVIFRNQTEVNNFDLDDYESINNLLIQTNSSDDPIVNLNTLTELQSINGSLIIANNYGLNSIEELDNLTNVGGEVSIVENGLFQSLTGLNNIIGNVSKVNILYNVNLINLDILNNINSIETDLNISGRIENMDSFNDLNSIGGSFDLYGNNGTSFSSISGFSNLQSIGANLRIYSTNLPNLSIFQNITTLENLDIGDNMNLTTLNGLENLNYISNDLYMGQSTLYTNDYCAIKDLILSNNIGGNVFFSVNAINNDIEGYFNNNCN